MEYFEDVKRSRTIKQFQDIEENYKDLINKAKCTNCSYIGGPEMIHCINCGDIFCSSECQSIYKKNGICIDTGEKCNFSLNSNVIKRIDELGLQFLCPYGCKLKMTYYEFFNDAFHITTCRYRTIFCKECKNLMRYKDIKFHILKCQFCNKIILKEREIVHYEQECEYWVEYCEKCGSPKDKMNLAEHSDKICIIESQRRKEIISYIFSLLLKEKIYCEYCNDLLPCHNKVKTQLNIKNINKLLPEGFKTNEEEISNRVLGEESIINFKVCEHCQRILCEREFINSKKCIKCNEIQSDSKDYIDKNSLKMEHFCETHCKYQINIPTSCHNCKLTLLDCCGLICTNCNSLFCSSCTSTKNKKNESVNYCIECNNCLKCIESNDENIKLHLNHLDNVKKSDFSSEKQRYNQYSERGLYKRKSVCGVPKDFMKNQLKAHLGLAEETGDRLSTKDDSSPSNKEFTKKKEINDFQEINEEERNGRRLTYDFSRLPKQTCKTCGYVNMYFEVECVNCKKYL